LASANQQSLAGSCQRHVQQPTSLILLSLFEDCPRDDLIFDLQDDHDVSAQTLRTVHRGDGHIVRQSGRERVADVCHAGQKFLHEVSFRYGLGLGACLDLGLDLLSHFPHEIEGVTRDLYGAANPI
jgi:hypothetical protein